MAKSVPVLPGIQPGHGPYSQVVEANGLVFLAGQVGEDPVTGNVPVDDIALETRLMFANAERYLGAVGLGLEDVVRTTVYLVDMADFATYDAIYREVFPVDPPTRATMKVAGLVDPYRIEMEVIAARRS